MTQTRLEAQGINIDTSTWDDGYDYDDVSKIYIGCGIRGIRSIYFDYVKDGRSIEGSRHGQPVYMVEVNFQENEYLESVSGTYRECYGIYSLVFKSNFKTFGPIMPMGDENVPVDMKEFTLAVKGKKIIGFHGSAYKMVNSLGAYVTWIAPTKVEAKGGKGGKEWDDGYEHEDVLKIHVRGGGYGGIQSIQFDYIRNGELKKGPLHGLPSGGYPTTYVINYLQGEYLVAVEGYYDEGSRVIQGIQFSTNMKIFEMMGYAKGTKFTVACNGNKINGFHGYVDRGVIISIGAYFTTTPCKLECVSSMEGGLSWDDGSAYDGIRKVFVDIDSVVNFISFEYEHRSKVIKTRRGEHIENEEEFVIDYPNEFITSVEGSIQGESFTSLTIRTSKGRTSPTFGDVTGSKFVLEKPGYILVGFYGRADYLLRALGAYYRPLPPPPDTVKLEAQGGDGGDYWDDGGAFYGIKSIFIGLTENNAIGFVKFMYVQNDSRIVFGDDHGSKTLRDVQEFKLDGLRVYLTSVEGDYDGKSGVITMLKFVTNKDSIVFGVDTVPSFILHKDGHQIVGFHGKSNNMLHQIGVHVLPIHFNYLLPCGMQ